MNIVKKLLKQKHKEYKKEKIYSLSGDTEYYTFKIPIYKTPPIPEYHKCFCWHKDDIIVDLDKKNKKLKNIIKKVREKLKEDNKYLENVKEMYIKQNNEILKTHTLQLINNSLVKNDELLEILDKEEN